MPRTRNVSRSQWEAANSGQEPKSTKKDEEKENTTTRAPRSTRSRTAGRTAFGVVNPGGATGIPTRNAAPSSSKAKGKGKPPAKPTLTKVEKLPLQDITSRFLPAQESENRGHAQPTGFGPPENLVLSPGGVAAAGPSTFVLPPVGEVSVVGRTNASRRVYPSSLPPSSPPSVSSNAHAQLPVLSRSPTPINNPLSRRLFAGEREAPPTYDAWKDFDFVLPESEASQSRPRAPSRNSDPFGFFALERKLEAEREEEDHIGGLVLVEDSSPLEDEQQYSDSSLHLPPQPPTPHKRSVIPRRESFSSEHVFSPRGSSCPSSPSPTKPSSKRKAAEFEETIQNDNAPGSTPHVPRKQPKRIKKVVEEVTIAVVEEEDEEPEAKPVLRRSRRGAQKKAAAEADEPPRKSRTTTKTTTTKKPTTTTKRKRSKVKKDTTMTTATKSKKSAPAILPEDDSDAEEKREREREARLAYFRELDEYEVETENVYVI